MIEPNFAYVPIGGGTSIVMLALIFFAIRPKRHTLLDDFIFWFGNASIVIVITLAILSRFYPKTNFDNVIAVDGVVYVLLMLMACIRYLGESNHISGFGRQLLTVVRKLLLFLFLPAAVVTGLSFAIAYVFFGIRF